MTQAEKKYQEWINHPSLDHESREELKSIARDAQEIEERFYKEIQFGTAGLRGILGAGTNRMNMYTVARAAEAYARFLKKNFDLSENKGIAISYDSRNFSREFANLVARIFVARGLRVYLSDELRPVPMLSFAIRHYGLWGGIMVTASHNPKDYNGLKFYAGNGAQIAGDVSDEVAKEIQQVENPLALPGALPSLEEAKESDNWHVLGKELDDLYDAMILDQSLNPELVSRQKDLTIVYTPLNGSGNKPIRRILRKLGFNRVLLVPEQEEPDGNFPTVPYPNPEEPKALELGLALAKKEAADLLIATDPDADRLGVAVRDPEGDYVILSGNQIGILFMDYILSEKKAKKLLEDNSFVVSTVVSSRVPDCLAEEYGVDLYRTLTGFKNIAEVIEEKADKEGNFFQFAYEESFGYLAGRDVRDKDGVVAAMLMAEMAAVSASRGETLLQRLDHIYQKHGYAAEQTISLVREGKEGQERMQACMAKIRDEKDHFFAPLKIKKIYDYKEQIVFHLDKQTSEKIKLDKSNVLVFKLDELDWFATRPSGTEPKLKIYMGCSRKTKTEAEAALAEMAAIVAERIEKVLDA